MKKIVLLALLSVSMTFAQTEVKNEVKQASKELTTSVKEVNNTLKDGVKEVQDTKVTMGTFYNDTKDGVKTVYTDLSSLGGEAKLAMKDIVQMLKEVSLKTWDLLVKQQLVWSILYSIICVISIILGYKLFKSVENIRTDLTETGDSKKVNWLYSFVILIFFITSSYTASINLEKMLTGYINPEFGALRTLVELANTNKGLIKND